MMSGICQYGESCYRLQESHFTSFDHPHLKTLIRSCERAEITIPANYKPKIPSETLINQLKIVKKLEMADSRSTSGASSSQASSNAQVKRGLEDYMAQVRKRCKGDVVEKLKMSEPYRFFLSGIAAESKTHDDMLSLTFPELLSEKLGVLESSLQINFMVDIGWLLAQYAVNKDKTTPMTLLYGCEDASLQQLIDNNKLPKLTAVYLKPSAFGSHHTKMMILSYEDKSIRVIITTGNLVESDWENTTQGMWVSPRLPYMEGKSGKNVGESVTSFKRDFLTYLEAYNLEAVKPWIQKVNSADFSDVKVFFVASYPGTHVKGTGASWGLNKIGLLLKKHAVIPSGNAKDWPLYYQCSSIGSLGKTPEDWFLGDVTGAMSSNTGPSSFRPPTKLIYPAFNDVASSHDGLLAGGCLPYQKATHQKQPWLNQYLCKWRSNCRNRTKAMPHIKTYCRLSPCSKYLSWFLLTSANMSKAAWGMPNKAKTNIRILNYEAGVLFIPNILISKNVFPLTEENSSVDGPKFTLHYDIPLTPYSKEDIPWFMDVLSDC